MFLNTGSGGRDIFEVKLTFDMLTLRVQQHSFSTHERVFLWKCQSFWDRKCLDLRGTRTPNFRIHAECSNLLSYQGQTFAVPCFLTLALAVPLVGYNLLISRSFMFRYCLFVFLFCFLNLSCLSILPLGFFVSFWFLNCQSVWGGNSSCGQLTPTGFERSTTPTPHWGAVRRSYNI